MQLKLIDFGLSNFSKGGDLHRTFCGTPAYAAPEMILSQSYSGPEVDVWSLGVVLHLMLVGDFPFQNVSSIITGQYTPPTDMKRTAADLLSRMFIKDCHKRVGLDEVQRHAWVTGSEVLYDTTVRIVACAVMESPTNSKLAVMPVEELSDSEQESPVEKRMKR